MASLKKRKRITAYISGIILMLVLCSFVPVLHKYYLSLTEIHIDTKKHTLDISSKFFMDDLEVELSKVSNKKVDISTSSKNKELEQLLFNYLDQNLKINIGGKLQKVNFVGYEIEDDAIWCYMEVANFKGKGTVSVLNSLLYGSFPDQANLINVSWDGVVKTARLTNPERFAEFIF